MALKTALALCLCAGIAAAQPGAVQPGTAQPGAAQPGAPVQPSRDPSAVLRDANAAATAGDWDRVAAEVDPLLANSLQPADLAEAQRLAGVAAFFHHDNPAAEAHFLAYLRIDLEGHLDPAIYPPEVVQFFDGVRASHAAELRARHPRAKRYWIVAPIPVASQIQNGETGKGIVIGSLIGAFAITNVTSYLVLRSWCHDPGSTCDRTGTNHYTGAQRLEAVNVASGIAMIAVAVYGVYDGVRGYQRRTRALSLEPYTAPSSEGAVFGIAGSF